MNKIPSNKKRKKKEKTNTIKWEFVSQALCEHWNVNAHLYELKILCTENWVRRFSSVGTKVLVGISQDPRYICKKYILSYNNCQNT